MPFNFFIHLDCMYMYFYKHTSYSYYNYYTSYTFIFLMFYACLMLAFFFFSLKLFFPSLWRGLYFAYFVYTAEVISLSSLSYIHTKLKESTQLFIKITMIVQRVGSPNLPWTGKYELSFGHKTENQNIWGRIKVLLFQLVLRPFFETDLYFIK